MDTTLHNTLSNESAQQFIDRCLLENEFSFLMQVSDDHREYPALWCENSRPLQPLSDWPLQERNLPCSLDDCCHYILDLIRAYEAAYGLHSIWYECRSLLRIIQNHGEPPPWFSVLCRAMQVGARREGVDVPPCKLETEQTSRYQLNAEIWCRWDDWNKNGYCWNRRERSQARRWLEYLKIAIEEKRGYKPAEAVPAVAEAATEPKAKPKRKRQSKSSSSPASEDWESTDAERAAVHLYLECNRNMSRAAIVAEKDRKTLRNAIQSFERKTGQKVLRPQRGKKVSLSTDRRGCVTLSSRDEINEPDWGSGGT